MSNIGTVLLTGASGFVGTATARTLRAQGYSVRALVRSTSTLAHIADLDLDFAIGDLRDAASLRRAMQGVRWVFHVAADYRLWARNPSELFETNVQGTRLLLEEARRAKAERIVYTSSVATIRTLPDGTPSDETHPLTEAEAIGAYKRSKVAAERLVEQFIRGGLPVIIVNPSTPVGPDDLKPTPTGRLILNAADGRMPFYVDTGLNVVHVDDVARGHVQALERGRIGERYILGGQNASLGEILSAVASVSGRRGPFGRIPREAAYPVACVSELLARCTGREPFATVDGLRMAKNRMYFSSAKAERELGYRPRPYAEGIRDAVGSFRELGYLRD